MSALDKYLKLIRKYIPYTKEEEKIIIQKAKDGDREAYEQLMCANLRFVVSVAKKYQNQGLELEDLIQEGNEGLMKAFHKFDLSKNFKFITYAVWWIRQSILNAIHDYAKLIKLPMNKISSISKSLKQREELEQTGYRELTYEELSQILDPDTFEDLKYIYETVRLDQSYTEDAKTLVEILSDDSEIYKGSELLNDELQEILNNFPVREREIILMYYGIGYDRGYTLKEIGDKFNLTRERIRQIKQKTLQKLMSDKYKNKLRDYL